MTLKSHSKADHGQTFMRVDRGDVGLLFGLSFFALVALIGLAVDIGRWLNARDKTVAAMDAAVLAGGRALQTNGGNAAAALAVAQKFYSQAVADRAPTSSDTIGFATADNGTAITSTGNAFIQTPIMNAAMKVIGKSQYAELPLLPTSEAEHSKAVLAVGGNAERSVEVAMMLDVSGSMQGDKLTSMKTAAKDLVNILVWQDQSKYYSKMSIVPFSADVRPPVGFNVAAMTTPVARFQRSNGQWFVRTGCVGERGGANRHTDAAPNGPANLLTRLHRPVQGTPSANATTNCQTPSSGAVVPLTSDKAALLSKIDGLTLGGGTAGHIGTAWAFYTLSPQWSAFFTGSSAPAAYERENVRKIAILMTDGEYNYTFNPDVVSGGAITGAAGTTESGGGSNAKKSINQTSSADQALQICAQMKAKGIEVFTVGFDLQNNATAINTLRTCATNPAMFYNAADGDELRQSFRAIALRMSSLQLTK